MKDQSHYQVLDRGRSIFYMGLVNKQIASDIREVGGDGIRKTDFSFLERRLV